MQTVSRAGSINIICSRTEKRPPENSYLRSDSMKSFILVAVILLACAGSPEFTSTRPPVQGTSWDPFLDTLQERTLKWFLDVTPQSTGLTPDRQPTPSPSSVAAVGFALTAYPIAAERKLITRMEAATRTLTTLRFLWKLPQNDKTSGVSGFRGFYYHFIDTETGLRAWNCELSTVDTGWLLAGVLFCQSYFDREDPAESEIRALSDSLYRRVDWQWAMGTTKGVVMGWTPENGFHSMIWHGDR